MILRIKADRKIDGYWDGGMRDTFDWSIDQRKEDSKGKYVRVGSWDANYWFHVAEGRTDKETLKFALQVLKVKFRRFGVSIEHKYIKEEYNG